jgi:hypothetical protein
MEIEQNEIRIDFRANPKLRAHYSSLEDGAEFKLEIKGRKKAMTDEAMIGVLESIAPSGYSEKEPMTGKVEKDVEPSAEEPMVVEVTSAE